MREPVHAPQAHVRSGHCDQPYVLQLCTPPVGDIDIRGQPVGVGGSTRHGGTGWVQRPRQSSVVRMEHGLCGRQQCPHSLTAAAV